MRVNDYLYLYLWDDPRQNNCNSVFISGKVPVLIDPGHAHKVDELLMRMKTDNVDIDSIKSLIFTHCHPDHMEGISAFDKSSIKKGISIKEFHFLEETARPMFAQHGTEFPDFKFDFFLREGPLNIGKHEFHVLETPGHSPGSICIYWPAQKTLIAGDLVFMQGVGRADLPGGDEKQLRESLKRVSELDIELVIPGHGPPIRGARDVKANFDYIKMAFLGGL